MISKLEKSIFSRDLAIDVWQRKYRLQGETFGEYLTRVSMNNQEYADIISNLKFIPGGRIAANLATPLSNSNCYFIPIDDSVDSIYKHLHESALTAKAGGGIGTDVSKLRPNGAPIAHSSTPAAGVIPVMELINSADSYISQNGRRGARMISLNAKHDDIKDFITVKQNGDKINKANLSVMVDDTFMQNVLSGAEHESELYDLMMTSAWKSAEPGILFENKLKNYNLMEFIPEFEVLGTNPCGEIPLPAYGACLLGAINLVEFVKITNGKKYFDLDAFKYVVKLGYKYLDEVLEDGMPKHPLQQQIDAARDFRQIGLGLNGLADLFIELGVVYGSEESKMLAKFIATTMASVAINCNALLAKDIAPMGLWKPEWADKVFESSYFKHITSNMEVQELCELKDMISTYGLRNASMLCIAPVGTGSLLAGTSNGLEPYYAFEYTRKTESLHEGDVYYKVKVPIAEKHFGSDSLVESKDIHWKDRVELQGILQQCIDQSISSTVNLPNETEVDEIKDMYKYAWMCGLKGITIYRDGCALEGVMVKKDAKRSDKLKALRDMAK